MQFQHTPKRTRALGAAHVSYGPNPETVGPWSWWRVTTISSNSNAKKSHFLTIEQRGCPRWRPFTFSLLGLWRMLPSHLCVEPTRGPVLEQTTLTEIPVRFHGNGRLSCHARLLTNPLAPSGKNETGTMSVLNEGSGKIRQKQKTAPPGSPSV